MHKRSYAILQYPSHPLLLAVFPKNTSQALCQNLVILIVLFSNYSFKILGNFAAIPHNRGSCQLYQ